jgi:hypothetical protein
MDLSKMNIITELDNFFAKVENTEIQRGKNKMKIITTDKYIFNLDRIESIFISHENEFYAEVTKVIISSRGEDCTFYTPKNKVLNEQLKNFYIDDTKEFKLDTLDPKRLIG